MRQRHGQRSAAIFSDSADGAVVTIRVTPRAARSEVAGQSDEALLVRLNAPPVDGAANRALVEYVAAACRVPRRAVTLVAGERGRMKRVAIAGLSAAEAEARLTPRPAGSR